MNEEALPDWIIVARRAAYGVLGPAGLQLDADLIRAGDLVRACECLAIARYRANESPIGYFKKAVRERYRANKRERAFSAQLVRACYISQNPLASDSRGVPATGGVSERTDNGVVKETNHGTARDQDEAARGDTRLGGLHKHRGREVQTHDAEGRGEAAPSDQTQIAPGRHTTGFVRQRHSSRRYTLAADVRRPPPHTSAGGVSSF